MLLQTYTETGTCKQQQQQLKNAARMLGSRFLWQTGWLGDKSGWATAAVLSAPLSLDQFSKP